MITALLCLFALVSGLCLGIGFIVGFKARVNYEEKGKFVGRVETVDPIQQTDRRVRELEEEEREQDAVL